MGGESVEEEESVETEVAAALAGAPEASESANLANSNQPLFFQDKPNFLKMMQQMTQLMGQAYIHVYRRGLESRLLDKLASHPGAFDTLQELMDITLELDTRYHERMKEKGFNQEKKPPVTGFNPSRTPQGSSSKRPHHKKNKKGKQTKASKETPHSALFNKDSK
ncbi:hypothetical protein O181_015328 [Austropuccinia psidii MF-1]|uniref:Uncharacterized protein n=1 Tax=Austropuccinia psidii MF-1 TaxID=1389203 RepID=A0A9Q3GPW3_9BASI|nr:hypothetical protein [Austropuccinia psidii MF-1]